MECFETGLGLKIPQIGLGTYDLKADAICNAIRAGYTLLDTAWQYRNEGEVGCAVRKSGIRREEVAISTKVWTEDIRLGRVREELEESLKALQTDYVDLYLIHWPAIGFERAWETMARLKEEGKVREIGVCNFEPHHFEELERVSGIVPVLNQIESHPYFQNTELIQYCKGRGVLAQAWCPLGGSYSKLTEEPVFGELAKKYGKTPAQVILRWHLQRGVWMIPRSGNPVRQRDNKELFDFALDDADMERIGRMDTGHRIGADPDNFTF